MAHSLVLSQQQLVDMDMKLDMTSTEASERTSLPVPEPVGVEPAAVIDRAVSPFLLFQNQKHIQSQQLVTSIIDSSKATSIQVSIRVSLPSIPACSDFLHYYPTPWQPIST